MLNITRFSPLEDAFENIFRGIPVWLPNPETRAPAPTPFRMDVTENDKEYRVLAELPGVKKEDINITINTLGQEVDEATAQAKYTDGVLELTLPKKAAAAAKRLAVH
jgi:HSP20 family protein